jgi:cytochrome d ubiquinol oxidase subunit II
MMSLSYVLLSILWLSLIVYAAFGGADFGAGVWDLFASGPSAQRQHTLIDQALGPVWETNHVWLVFLVVGLFSAFPSAFAALCVVLFFPLTLALIGSVLRGAAFVFRTHGLRTGRPAMQIWTRTFSFASILTPFLLGSAAAAVASGQIHFPRGATPQTNTGSFWLTPFALTIGLMAVALCTTLAALYLTVEASNERALDLAEAFRKRGLLAGAITALLGACGLLLSRSAAPLLWQGMLSHAWPLVIATMLIGVATALALFYRYYQIARLLIIAETAFLLGSWGISQVPYLIPPDVLVEGAASAPATLLLLLIGILIGMAIIIPSIYALFRIFKLKNRHGFFEKGVE